MAERLARLRDEHDDFRSAVVNEPRGSDVMVGALLCEPVDPACAAGVIFFNNVGYLGMCGHGTIGLVVTLAHLGRISPGDHRIETPVGMVTATLAASGEVTFTNRACLPASRSTSGWMSMVTDECTATSPGAATGSSWSTTTGKR